MLSVHCDDAYVGHAMAVGDLPPDPRLGFPVAAKPERDFLSCKMRLDIVDRKRLTHRLAHL